MKGKREIDAPCRTRDEVSSAQAHEEWGRQVREGEKRALHYFLTRRRIPELSESYAERRRNEKERRKEREN
jgi:hypothetical protein